MGAEGAVNIIFRRQVEEAEDPEAKRAELVDGIRKVIDPYIAAGNALIDDVIDPRETRLHGDQGVRDGGDQASGPAVEAPRGDAGVSGKGRLRLLHATLLRALGPSARSFTV
jgi:hypothetical protein